MKIVAFFTNAAHLTDEEKELIRKVYGEDTVFGEENQMPTDEQALMNRPNDPDHVMRLCIKSCRDKV